MMDEQTLINLLLAVLIAASLHELGEPWNLMNKLKRINDALHKTDTARKPTVFNTTPRALLGSGMFITGVTLGAYLAIGIFNPSLTTAIWTTIITLVGVEIINSLQVDRFHRAATETIKDISQYRP